MAGWIYTLSALCGSFGFAFWHVIRAFCLIKAASTDDEQGSMSVIT